jgi:hypothetical protein
MLFILTTLVLNLWYLETIVFLHWCLKCAIILVNYNQFHNFIFSNAETLSNSQQANLPCSAAVNYEFM